MQLVKRDIEILQFINEFGYCDMPRLMKQFQLKKTWMYEIVQRLISEKLLKHERIFHAKHGVYYLTVKGAKYTDLPPIDRVTVGRYEHHMCVLSVYSVLKKKYPSAHWVTERKLKYDLFFDGIGKSGHVADGMLQFPDGKQIAIEVELSVKGRNRIEKILKGYGAKLAIHEVWYFCTKQVMLVLTSISQKMPFIKLFYLDEFLHDE